MNYLIGFSLLAIILLGIVAIVSVLYRLDNIWHFVNAWPRGKTRSRPRERVSEDMGTVAVQEFILHQADLEEPGCYWQFKGSLADDGYQVVIFWTRKSVASDPQPTYAAALAQALERALGEKP